MSAQLLDGKQTAQYLRQKLKQTAQEYIAQGITPGLAVIVVGEDTASKIYVKNKQKACEEVGIKSFTYNLPEATGEHELLDLIRTLNQEVTVDGILVQLPLPSHLNTEKIIAAIDPKKDVDGFHQMNAGALMIGTEGFRSCTPLGIMALLKHYKIKPEGKKCVVVGRSNIVGKPMAFLLLKENATVTICHSYTQNLKAELQTADIVVVAVGKKHIVTGNMLKKGCVVVDVGMNRDETNKLCGDVDAETVKEVASYMTPVPGGVGPMTITMLLKNCLDAARKRGEL
jgi:methylenetetrahydrofolate dehydrogenase (NADP+)/methenyltetrahydrofolate cyclohydrolase